MALIASYDNNSPRTMAAWPGWKPGIGETELDPMTAVGSRFWFPNQETRERLKRYIEMEQLLDVDKHYRLFTKIAAGDAPEEGNWLPIDFPGMLARLMRHYSLGPEFAVKATKDESDPEIQRIFDEGRLVERLRQCSEAFPVFGDAVLRIDLEECEDEDCELVPLAVPKFIHPGNYHPVFDPVDATKIKEVVLAYVFSLEESERKARNLNMPFVVLKEHHYLVEGDENDEGRVEYSAVEWDGNKEGEPFEGDAFANMFPGLQDGPTGIDEIPIIHIPYNPKGSSPWGRSEFHRIERLFLALENRITQEDEILERHARPKLIVGPGVLNPEGRANLADFDVIEIDPSILEKAVKPEYLTWDPKIEAVKHEIETLLDFFFMTTETSPASFGMERSGSQVESARALRFKAHRTINKIQDLHDTLSFAIKSLFRISQKMELAAREEEGLDAYERTPVYIDFSDPIVEDRTQEATDYAQLRANGLVSRTRAVKDLFNLTPEEADIEVKAIEQDELQSAWLPQRVTESPRSVNVEIPGAPAGEQPPKTTAPGGKAPSVPSKRAPGAPPQAPTTVPKPKP